MFFHTRGTVLLSREVGKEKRGYEETNPREREAFEVVDRPCDAVFASTAWPRTSTDSTYFEPFLAEPSRTEYGAMIARVQLAGLQ